jgi:hypothetical protein
MNADTPTSPSFSHVLIALFKEVLHAEEDAPLWQSLLNSRPGSAIIYQSWAWNWFWTRAKASRF